jgi:hypothetical protein
MQKVCVLSGVHILHFYQCVLLSGLTINYHIFPSITRALSIQKHSVNGKKRRCGYTMNARYAIKIEKIPNHLHTYVHNLKQRISQK